MSPDPKRLLELLSIAELGSYTKAAKALRISQPALSSSITALEASFGVRLLQRGKQGANLTEFGSLLIPYARALRAALERATSDVEKRKMGVHGALTIGATPAAAGRLVPDIVTRFLQQSSNVTISISEGVDDTLIGALRAGELDLVFSPLRNEPDKADLEDEPLLPDPIFIAMSPRHPKARYKSVSLKQLHEEKWILPNPRTVISREIESIFAVAGVPWPSDAIICNSVAAIVALIERSERVTVMSRQLMLRERSSGKLAHVPLRNAKPLRSIGIRRRKGAEISPLAARFIEIARGVAQDLARNAT